METGEAQRRVAVFCSSSLGNEPAYAELAADLGRRLADEGIGVVFGGGRIGLMGVMADAVMAAGGEVIGVIPNFLDEIEVAHQGLTELHLVNDMHERKQLMYSLSDGFCALPGGLGTMEELFEAATWTQLGLHEGGRYKPVVLLDEDGFWKTLAEFHAGLVENGFVKPDKAKIIQRAGSIDQALELLYQSSS
ncbi:MAG: TIGR00730 family Rossman fold protein [bacterium]|nr:TIGR00730 family Rossman fold protein [bacterium]MXZ78704.1 TIGR00730 family Rossman fold protein [Acidimicrobiia bacterium]MDE0613495.1 TIGR00730 family Rossman fold protein [bacterium]MXZ86458.1 TIGR00730 family Rossman fold protein [Acidimicrobiia bacterium]MYB10309.1 TIGR00730 family Rossman fold protein [Acidimicrobiia bacterium]